MPDRFVLRTMSMSRQASKIVSTWSHVGGVKMHARGSFAGAFSRAPLVLVHGLGVSSRYFGPLIETLAEAGTPVLAPDLPGTGRSGDPAHPLDLDELASTLLRWLDARNIHRTSFVANSMGCQVIAKVARWRPDRIDRLVLVGPTVDPKWRGAARQIPRWLLESTREPLALFPTLVRDYLRFGLRRFVFTARAALEGRLEADARHVVVKTLVVRGERDAFVSDAWARSLASSFPNGSMATLTRAAHAAHYTQPEELVRMMGPFLRDRERRAERTRDTALGLHLSPVAART